MSVDVSVQDHVATVTLNRPEARNAINRAMSRGLSDAVDAVESDPDVRVAVLQANTQGQPRPVFSAGADLRALSEGEAPGTERGLFGGFLFAERRKPFIAAVDGLAVAGGVELTLACDLIVATDRSEFAMFEVKRNLLAGAGAFFRLPRAIGRHVALELLLLAEPVPAPRLYDLGLFNRLVPAGQAEATAHELARLIARNAPLAVEWSRAIVNAAEDVYDDHIRRLSEVGQRDCSTSSDTAEGLAAFLEGREPVWRGRGGSKLDPSTVAGDRS